MTVKFKFFSHQSHKFIKDLMEGRGLEGECYALAIVLSRELGWPIYGLMQGEEIYHAIVLSPDGAFWDARGIVSKENLGKPFGISPPYDLRLVTEEDLLAVKPAGQMTLDFVLRLAQALWPKLPWKSQSDKDKLLSFASELEALSRKYNYWIYGCTPTALPRIAQGQRDETGYLVSTTIDGMSFTINRIIG